MKFGDINGQAKKINVDYYKFTEGKNNFRLVGDVLPRYVYWLEMPEVKKNAAVECLAFDRKEEKFNNAEVDYVSKFFPEKKCSWSYLVQVIDLDDGKLKMLGLKKKLFQQILDMANEHLGDPTDIVKGWDVMVLRKKTGPLDFNVEYTLDQLACKQRELNAAELEAIAEIKPIEEIIPRPTPTDQKAFIEKVWFNKDNKEEKAESAKASDMPKGVTDDFEDDIPF